MVRCFVARLSHTPRHCTASSVHSVSPNWLTDFRSIGNPRSWRSSTGWFMTSWLRCDRGLLRIGSVRRDSTIFKRCGWGVIVGVWRGICWRRRLQDRLPRWRRKVSSLLYKCGLPYRKIINIWPFTSCALLNGKYKPLNFGSLSISPRWVSRSGQRRISRRCLLPIWWVFRSHSCDRHSTRPCSSHPHSIRTLLVLHVCPSRSSHCKYPPWTTCKSHYLVSAHSGILLSNSNRSIGLIFPFRVSHLTSTPRNTGLHSCTCRSPGCAGYSWTSRWRYLRWRG